MINHIIANTVRITWNFTFKEQNKKGNVLMCPSLQQEILWNTILEQLDNILHLHQIQEFRKQSICIVAH